MDDYFVWKTPNKTKFYSNCLTCLDCNKIGYIKYGDICSICLYPIINIKNAWLTPCRHSYHHICLLNYFYNYSKDDSFVKYSNDVPCPLCRCKLVDCCVTNDDDFENKIDELEDFWKNIHKKQYITCYKCKNPLGFTKNCDACVLYTKTGEI